MTPNKLYLLVIAIVAIGTVAAQNGDELQIPVENDNQFPPDKHSDTIDGSGDGVIEEPEETDGTTTEGTPPIEQIQAKVLLEDTLAAPSEGDDDLCPKPCVCRMEESDFVVDCSGYDLTELPTPINEKVTKLYLQKNKLTEIPKEVSTLKNLKVLNANDNYIMTLVPGSVSELPALVSLKLRNNRLIEYPHDLKNSFGLTNLEEIDLGGNDLRTVLTTDLFEKFEALRTIILPSSSKSELAEDLCVTLPKNLKNVCIESCENQLFECQSQEEGLEEDLPVIPGMLPSSFDEEDETDPVVSTPKEDEHIEVATLQYDLTTEANGKTTSVDFSFRSAVNKQPSDVVMQNAIVEAPKNTSATDPSVKVGATTSETNTGAVDKSIIGLVLAGMVVIIAGITIKKNWTSIKKRFSSESRTPAERNGTNANGSAPEEVPLQDKSPV